jgi:hypothetical protein
VQKNSSNKYLIAERYIEELCVTSSFPHFVQGLDTSRNEIIGKCLYLNYIIGQIKYNTSLHATIYPYHGEFGDSR